MVQVASADAEMNAAIADARRTLPEFWRRFEARQGQSFTLKVGLATAHQSVEHIWVDVVQRRDGVITGTIDDDPADLPGLKSESVITVDPKRISDWGYMAHGKLYGHFTTRILVKTLNTDEARRVEAMLSPNPLESNTN